MVTSRRQTPQASKATGQVSLAASSLVALERRICPGSADLTRWLRKEGQEARAAHFTVFHRVSESHDPLVTLNPWVKHDTGKATLYPIDLIEFVWSGRGDLPSDHLITNQLLYH